MTIEKRQIPDSFVGFARSLPDDFLQPGMEPGANAYIAEHKDGLGPTVIGDDPVIYALTGRQRDQFKADFRRPTPEGYGPSTQHQLTRYALLQLTVAHTIGQPYGLYDLRDGAVVQDVFPSVKHEERVSSSFGSRKAFNFHTDQAYNPDVSLVPDVVLLAGIRNTERAATLIASLSRIVVQLSDEQQERLRESSFIFYRGRPEENIGKRQGPILLGDTAIRLGTDVVALSAADEEALRALQEAAAKVAEPVVLEPGQLLFTPNYTNVHSRTAFEPARDLAERRWLQRIDIKTLK